MIFKAKVVADTNNNGEEVEDEYSMPENVNRL
jgi:hypothetical protein